MIKLKAAGKEIPFESAEWTGSATQCSREVSFTVPWNPYDKDFHSYVIRLGDLVHLYSGKELLYVGTVTERTQDAAAGTASYVSKDFMHHLLRSNGTYKFINISPEKIVEKICRDLKIKTKSLAKTGAHIRKMIVEDTSYYDIIVKAYKKAYTATGKKYMPVMDGKCVSVIVKGEKSGVVLDQKKDITDASYSDTTDNMVNIVQIYNDKKQRLGQVQNNRNIEKYGVYKQVYIKEEKVNAKTAAKAMLVGVTREATVEAMGNIKAVSGKSVVIKDSATGLSGTFYIENDTHLFENGTHTMSLELSWNVNQEETKEKKDKAVIGNTAVCFYLKDSEVYHSSYSCPACKGKKMIRSTVHEMKKIKIASGENKGKRKYRPCSRCWET